MLLRIDHETRLSYSHPVAEGVLEVRMAPPTTEDQTVLGYRLRTIPNAPLTTSRDGFGNRVELFNVLLPHREVVINATSFVRVHRRPSSARLGDAPLPVAPFPVDVLEFLWPSPLVPHCAELRKFVAQIPKLPSRFEEATWTILEAVRNRLKYEKKVTTAQTSVSEVLKLNAGVCQDFAHLYLGAARMLGLPARYVSGYIKQPGEIATHAWVQVWGGVGLGWVDVDPTHAKFAEAEHVVTAVGRDFSDVPPNQGVWKGAAEETIAVTVSVHEVERVPTDFIESVSQPSWSNVAAGRPSKLNQQALLRGFRQQQSQQQQMS